MRTIDEEFRDLLSRQASLDEDAAEQLRHAAGALARMEPWMASSISCTRHVPRDQLALFADFARRVAAEYRLGVRVEPTNPAYVRFYRKDGAASR